MKNLLRLATIVAVALSLSGCATLFGDNTRQVSVNSNPQGAKVYLNNQYMGTTPTTLTMSSLWDTNIVELKKPGHEPIVRTVNTSFQPVTILDILLWPTLIIDGVSGDMMKISPDSRNITATFAH